MANYVTRAGGGRVVLRDLFGGADAIPLPSQDTGSWTAAGTRVNTQRAVGLPAVLSAIRLLSETIGILPMVVYADGTDGRDRATKSWQWSLLHDKPNEHCTPFDFYSFLMASLQGYGNAYVLKAKARGEVRELYNLDPRRVRPKVTGNDITFEVRSGDYGGASADTRILTRQDILHIPGVLLDNPYIGVSPILVQAQAIGAALATEEYAARFFANDGTPAGIIEFPAGSDTQQAKDTREAWENRHRGGPGRHRVGALFGGAKYQQIGVNAQEAQIIDAQKWSIEQVARCFRVPAWAIGGSDQNPRATPEQHNRELLEFSVQPWMVRIEQAMHADDDLFPDKAFFPEFLADALVRADISSRYDAYLKGRQAGWLSVNDIRRTENLPEIPEGDQYQVTPVGGAPNLQPANAPAQSDGEGGQP